MAFQRSNSISYYHYTHPYSFLSLPSSAWLSRAMASLFYYQLDSTSLSYSLSLNIDIIFLCILSHLLETSALTSYRYCRCQLAHICHPIEIILLMKNYPFKCEEEWIKFNLSIVIIVQMIILLDQKLDLPEDFSWDITVFMISPLESEKYCHNITPVLHFPWLFA